MNPRDTPYIRMTGIVLARNGPAEGEPADISYDILVGDEEGSKLFTGVQPTRRVSVGAQVIGADEGAPAEVVIFKGSAHFYVPEGIPFDECAGGAGPSFDDRIRRLEEQIAAMKMGVSDGA